MEHWLIQYRSRYDAVPWPFAQSWDEFIRQPEALVGAVDDLGCESPRDYLSETPSVPADLPRAMPRGLYRMAAYYDSQYVYVFLESSDAQAAPGLEGDARTTASVTFISADDRFTYHFTRGDRYELQARIVSNLYGPRAQAPPQRELKWDHAALRWGERELSCWRIARESITDVFVGDTLRFSVSRACYRNMEAVAWGSHAIWGPRIDEMGALALVQKRRRPLWPVVRRMELDYDPATERGRFRIRWEGVYGPDEQPKDLDLPDWGRSVPWGQFALRLNGRHFVLPLTDTAETDWLPIAEGDNLLEVASIGGPATAAHLEKRSGNRIVDNALPPAPPPSPEDVRRRIDAECQAAIQAMETRRATGQALTFQPWCTYHAASLGRVYHYLGGDPKLLTVLREMADYTLTLQRDDGTFAGLTDGKPGHRGGAPWEGGAYDTGPAGELWAVAAWLLKDDKYLQASRKLLPAYAGYRVEFNHNYSAFALFHLATHYRLTRDAPALEHGLYYCKTSAARGILPLGFQSGHNYYSEYGGITLRGLAQFCAVLPDGEPYKATLRELCIRMANQLISRQQDDGRFDARSRYFLQERHWLSGLFNVAFLVGPEDAARIDAAICRMFLSPPRPEPQKWAEKLAESDFVRYWAHRAKLLAGEPIDPLSLI